MSTSHERKLGEALFSGELNLRVWLI